MKKLALLLIPAITLLSGCSTTTKSSPVPKLEGLKHVCIKDAENPRIPAFTKLIAENLQSRGITSEIKTDFAPHCQYALAYSLKAKNDLVDTAKLRLSLMNDGSRKNLGEVSYWFKGSEEKQRIATLGLKGQVDTLVNELFQNN